MPLSFPSACRARAQRERRPCAKSGRWTCLVFRLVSGRGARCGDDHPGVPGPRKLVPVAVPSVGQPAAGAPAVGGACAAVAQTGSTSLVATDHVKKGHKTGDFGARIPGKSAARLSLPKMSHRQGGSRERWCASPNAVPVPAARHGTERQQRQTRSPMAARKSLSLSSWRTAKVSFGGES